MYEKVNPEHPDKVADRIAGAIVDLAYKETNDPKVAVEVLIGHGKCHIINETSVALDHNKIDVIVKRISGQNVVCDYHEVRQDNQLNKNQQGKVRCGDNGIFKGMPITEEQRQGRYLAETIYNEYKTDGKYIINAKENNIIICQSNADEDKLRAEYPNAEINPLGHWTGGIDVDTGATNRKLGSDMGDAVTGGGLHGKDLSKADVSVNIYAHLLAQKQGIPVEMYCAIGDEYIDGYPVETIVDVARNYICKMGGFEKFAEWGLI